MLTEIKIMLGMGEPQERNPAQDNYDSFVQDLHSSDNKTRPQLDDHNFVTKLLRMLRNDDVEQPMSVADSMPYHSSEEGLVQKLRRMMARG